MYLCHNMFFLCSLSAFSPFLKKFVTRERVIASESISELLAFLFCPNVSFFFVFFRVPVRAYGAVFVSALLFPFRFFALSLSSFGLSLAFTLSCFSLVLSLLLYILSFTTW